MRLTWGYVPEVGVVFMEQENREYRVEEIEAQTNNILWATVP